MSSLLIFPQPYLLAPAPDPADREQGCKTLFLHLANNYQTQAKNYVVRRRTQSPMDAAMASRASVAGSGTPTL